MEMEVFLKCKSNEDLLTVLKSVNFSFKNLNLIDGHLNLHGKKGFYLDPGVLISFININEALRRDIENLSAEEFFDIVSLHQKGVSLEKNNALDSEVLSEVVESSPEIEKPEIIRKEDEQGLIQEYVKIVDEFGAVHLFNKYSVTDVLEVYNLLIQKGTNITIQDLKEALEEKMHKVSMVDVDDIKNSYKPYSQDFIDNMELLENRNITNKRILGSEEAGLAVDQYNNVVNFKKDDHGNTVHETFKSEDEMELNHSDSQVEIVVIRLSTSEYYNLLDIGIPNQVEREQINDFEAFICELIIYEEYLLPSLAEILMEFRNKMVLYEALNSEENQLNYYQSNALSKYYKFQENKELYTKSKKPQEKVLTLDMQKPKKDNDLGQTGYVSSIVIAIFTTILGIGVAFLLIFISR